MTPYETAMKELTKEKELHEEECEEIHDLWCNVAVNLCNVLGVDSQTLSWEAGETSEETIGHIGIQLEELVEAKMAELAAAHEAIVFFRDEIAAARWQMYVTQAELAAARETLAKLPHTADGKPIVPGMIVWTREHLERFMVPGIGTTGGGRVESVYADSLMRSSAMVGHWIYSSREAAEAAR